MDEFYDTLSDQAVRIAQLLTDYDNIGDGLEHRIDISGTVTQDTCDLELYVTFTSADGRKLSHTEMIAEGLITQTDYDEISKVVAKAARKTPEFEQEGILIFPSN